MRGSRGKVKAMAVHFHKETATVLLVALLLNLLPATQSSTFNRTSFPPDFIFGASSASYQYEGAAFEDGKGRSIWDTFVHQFPGKIENGDNGDVADNFYHLYKEDVELMDYIGLDAFRFSISWPRILPSGKLCDGVNKAGVAFYNNLINELLSKGIKPFVTIFHWDLPQALEDEYGGFLHPNIIKDFQDFSEVCFKEFGDRVKHWATINEPYIFVKDGYDAGNKAPGRCSAWKNNNCPAGESATEPYIVAHNMILCHAATVKLYKKKYQALQKGVIGITQVSNWMVPYSASSGPAAQRALDFMFGWYMDPLAYGDYPESMRKLVQKRLPKFSPEEAKMVKGSYDYIGINYYSSNYAAEMAPGTINIVNVSSSSDSQVNLTTSRKGKPIGPPTDVSIFFVYPKDLRELLVYMKEKYNNPIIYIHENGYGEIDNGIVKKGVNDPARVSFYYRHILAVKQAMKKGVNVKGFFPWSFLDTFEWGHGFSHRFGINYVDYKDGLKRYPKKSALWFKKFLVKH